MGNKPCTNKEWYAIEVVEGVSLIPKYKTNEISAELDKRYPEGKRIESGINIPRYDTETNRSSVWKSNIIGWLCDDPCVVMVHLIYYWQEKPYGSRVFVLTDPDLLRISAWEGFDRSVGSLLYEAAVKGNMYDHLMKYIANRLQDATFKGIHQDILEYANMITQWPNSRRSLVPVTSREVTAVNADAERRNEMFRKPGEAGTTTQTGKEPTAVYRGGKF